MINVRKQQQTCFYSLATLSSMRLIVVYYKLCNSLNSLVLSGNTINISPYIKKKAAKINGGGGKSSSIEYKLI